MKTNSIFLAAAVLSAPAFAQGADECSAAVDLGTGSTTAAFDTNLCTDTGVAATTSVEQQCISLSEDVWFRYTAATTGLASFDTCNNATFDTEIGVWEGADCSTFVALGCNDDNAGAGCAGNTSFLDNIPVTAGQTYYIQLGFWSAAGGTFGSGTLTITEFSDPCSVLVPDAFESNDDCASAAAIADGLYTGLNAGASDSDFFSVTVPDGGTLAVDAFFLTADCDLDVYLWDPLVACDSNIEGEGAASSLATGFSGSDNEAISYTNATGADQNLVIEIDAWSGSTGQCASYDLQISGAGATGPGPIGTNYCAQELNSTGSIGTMSGFGLTSIAANDITVTASNLPLNQFGFFVVSDTQSFVPFAGGSSNGNICLGGVIGRYQNNIVNSGAAGSISLSPNVNTIPAGAGILAVSAGVSTNWQAWYRDQVGVGSNFTDGLEIVLSN